MPAYSGLDSFASSRRTTESIYYTAKEYDSAEEDSDCTRRLSEEANTLSRRRYIDPWDLENYVYIRKQVLDPTSESDIPQSPAGEPIQSQFYYVPAAGEIEDCQRCYAGLEEEIFFNDRYDTIMDEDIMEDEFIYSTYTDIETSSADHPSSCDSSMSALQLHTPGFGAASGRRPIVLPKPVPQLEFPGPPSYDYYDGSCCYMPPENNYYSLNDCIECVQQTEDISPLYATNRRRSTTGRRDSQVNTTTASSANICYTPQHFSLSKKGLLQIDYSCNWNNLDRYIAK